MRVAGIDFSSHAVDVVTVPYEGVGAPVWTRFPLVGADAFDRARSVAQAVPGPSSVFWEEILSVGIEEPTGKFKPGTGYRIQGAILARIPARMLVQPWPPSRWRKAVGLPGNASKADVWEFAWDIGDNRWMTTPDGFVPYDCTDAYCIALATLDAITKAEAA
jgi:hypothetical protein